MSDNAMESLCKTGEHELNTINFVERDIYIPEYATRGICLPNLVMYLFHDVLTFDEVSQLLLCNSLSDKSRVLLSCITLTLPPLTQA